jgi:hypothetical protein
MSAEQVRCPAQRLTFGEAAALSVAISRVVEFATALPSIRWRRATRRNAAVARRVLNQTSMGTFLHRLIGAALLDADTYEEVEADHTATLQALAVVVLASLAAGVGASRGRADSPLSFFFGTTFLSLAAWVTWAFVMYMVGTLILPTRETRTDMGELLRTLGFAAAPGLLQVFAVVPGATASVFALCGLWTLATTVVAVRQALDFTSTARALAVCGLGWILSVTIAVLLGLAFGPNLNGAWQLYAGTPR